MKPTRLLQFLAIYGFIFACIIACSRGTGNGLSISSKNFEDEINLKENLSFTFNHELASDSMLQIWDSTNYIEFNPPILGKFKWTSPNELIFSPFQPFPPNTQFKGKLTNKLAALGNLSLNNNYEFDFHTPYLVLNSTNAFWKLANNNPNNIVAGANLIFNYDILPKDLIEKLKIKIEGKDVKYTINSNNDVATNNINIEINTQNIEKETTISIEIEKGLNVPNSTFKTNKPIVSEITLQSPSELTITSVNTEHDGTEGYVKVVTSQQINESNLDRLISIEPEVKKTIEYNGNGFTIVSSEFDVTKTYKLIISKDLNGVFKGKLDQKYTTQITFGKLEPNIEFVHKDANYLGKNGKRNVALRIVGVNKVQVKIAKIFENNIQAIFTNEPEHGYFDEYDEATEYYNYHSFINYDIDKYGQNVFTKTYDVSKLPITGKVSLLNIDFQDKIPQFDGIYVIQVSDLEHNYITDSKIMAYSDIGLIVKQEKDKIYVFSNSIQTALPLSGTEIKLISSNNQTLETVSTNEEGIAIFSNLSKKAPNFKVSLVTARKENDFNYLLFNQANVNTARFNVGGKRSNLANVEAFIYSNRDLYRPGEKINLNTIVRNNEWETLSEIPIKIKLLLPNGKEYKLVRKTLNQQGAAESSFQLTSDCVTGTYIAEVYTADDVLLNSLPISVEEFLPDRIKLETSTNAKKIGVNQEIILAGKATNLFGPPAANRNFEIEMQLKRKPFAPKNYKTYTFDIENNKVISKVVKEGKTNEKGEFEQTFKILEDYSDMGILQGQLFTTVFDESGRPVNKLSLFDVYTQNIFYGIGNFTTYTSSRKPISIPLIALDENEKILKSAELDLKIIRNEWRTVMESNGNGSYNYRSQKEQIIESSQRLKISGENTVYTFTPSRSGEYEVRISRPESQLYVKREFYSYSYGDTQSTSFEVNRDGEISIELDKETYQLGETATVLCKTPFEGKLLITIERDQILRQLYFDTDKKSKQFSFEITSDYVPNVFISATLIRPMKNNDVPLTVAHGFANVTVQNPKNELPVKIIAAPNSRSLTKQTVSIETSPNTQVTLALVDEGILQIKDFKTPDPKGFFYQKRALEVNSYDIYPFLFPEIIAGGSLEGGDAGFDLSKRVNPITNKRVELVSFWSGILTTNSNGKAEYTVDIPQFSGDLRIMAVAYNNKRFGNAEAHIKVADPIVISTGLPRFVSPNDKITVPATITNTTNKDVDAKVSLVLSGALQALNTTNQTVHLRANSENNIEFLINATNNVGESSVTINAESMGETFVNKTFITVRPPSSLLKKSIAGSINAGQTQNMDLENDFIPQTIGGELLLSTSPAAQLGLDLKYLLGYPHGCIEQTVSKAFPQVYLPELSKSLYQNINASTGKNEFNPNYNVQEAIKKIQTMQLSNGGLSYWQGSKEANWWGSVFAAHFLYEAKRAGFEVSEKSLEALFDFLRNEMKNKQTFKYFYYNSDNKEMYKNIAYKEIPYTLYVLALSGHPTVSIMNYYKANLNLLSLDGKYLLAAAFALAGDKAKSASVLPASYSGENSKPSFDDSFYSPIRDKALALNALLEIDINNPQIGTLAKQLTSEFKNNSYLNTQERVFALLAFGKMAKLNANANIQATVLANGKVIGTFSGKDVVIKNKDINTSKLSVNTTGNSGTLYYFWNMEGLSNSTKPIANEDKYLKIRKQFFDRFGKPIKDNTFNQNDLVVVQLSLVSTGASKVNNVVITDMLPAGFEIENPRITDNHDYDWIKNSAIPVHKDIRDDRINLFVNATNENSFYYYAVRAVTAGTFIMGAASADAMYNGEYHSYYGAGSVTVNKK